ncbi:MAG: hypothetical protein VZR73_08700 [Acutalibacteraceae bacterium]|nr:hypothetical protein [Acutalibacteraceae bacterium]
MANKTIEHGFCALCKRALLSPEGLCTLSDGNQICSKCIRRLRVMLPLTVLSDDGNTLKDDPMMKLNLAEAKQKMQNVTAYTEKLRANYQNANAVFAVDQVQTEKGGFLKPPIYYATGRVIYGYFDPADQVQLKHGGNAFDLLLENVLKIGSIGARFGNNIVQGIGGTQCVLQFSGKGIECAPGDLIVRR